MVQAGYAERVLRTFGIWDCNSVLTPMDPVERVVEAVVVGRAERAVEALLVGRGVAERRARNGLRDAPGAVGVQRADDADVAGAVEARVARAVRDGVAPGRALAVVGARQGGLRNRAAGAVVVRRTLGALRVEAVVAVAHPAGVVGVEPG